MSDRALEVIEAEIQACEDRLTRLKLAAAALQKPKRTVHRRSKISTSDAIRQMILARPGMPTAEVIATVGKDLPKASGSVIRGTLSSLKSRGELANNDGWTMTTHGKKKLSATTPEE